EIAMHMSPFEAASVRVGARAAAHIQHDRGEPEKSYAGFPLFTSTFLAHGDPVILTPKLCCALDKSLTGAFWIPRAQPAQNMRMLFGQDQEFIGGRRLSLQEHERK